MDDKVKLARSIAKEFCTKHQRWLEMDGREIRKFELKASTGIEEPPEDFIDQPLIRGINDFDFYIRNYDGFEAENNDWLIKQAETESEAYDAVIELIVQCLENDTPLDMHLQSFLLKHLRGDIQRPTQRGPNKTAYRIRNIIIARAIDHVSQRANIHKTRNDASVETSACDIIAQELNCSYELVKRIWHTYKDNQDLWNDFIYTDYFED